MRTFLHRQLFSLNLYQLNNKNTLISPIVVGKDLKVLHVSCNEVLDQQLFYLSMQCCGVAESRPVTLKIQILSSPTQRQDPKK